ncbi:hypothetical protein DV738_g2385, partial [Chaetothyriales sp. CBS 135597]
MRLHANRAAEQPATRGRELEPEHMSPYMYINDIHAMETERKNKEAAKEAAQRPTVVPGKTLVLNMMEKPADWHRMGQSDRFRLKKDFLIQLCGANNVWFEEDGLPKKNQDIFAFRLDYFAAFEVADDPAATQAFKDTYMLTTRLCNKSIAQKDMTDSKQFDELVGAIYRRNQAYRAWAAGKRREAACRAKSYKLPALPTAAAPRTPAAPPAPIPASIPSAKTLASTYISKPDASSGKRKAAVMSTDEGQDNGPAPKKKRTMAPQPDTNKNHPKPSIATRPSAMPQPQARSYVGPFNRDANKNYQQPFIAPRQSAVTQPQATPLSSLGSFNRGTNKSYQQPFIAPRPSAATHTQPQAAPRSSAGPPAVLLLQNQIANRFASHVQQKRMMQAHYASVVERYHGLLQLIIRSRRLQNGDRKEPGEIAKCLRDIANLLGFQGWAINLAVTPEANMHDLARRHFSRHLDMGMQVLEVDRVAASVAGILSRQLAAHHQQY